jgi:hypothetical protein
VPPGKEVVNKLPDLSQGEYEDEDGTIKVCKACVPGSKVRRHTCGLSGLQDMLWFR